MTPWFRVLPLQSGAYGCALGSVVVELSDQDEQARTALSGTSRPGKGCWLPDFGACKTTGERIEISAKAISTTMSGLPTTLIRSITWDQGIEMARHTDITADLDVMVYFCDPRSPWQRDSNENANDLLRQYFPKGTSLNT